MSRRRRIEYRGAFYHAMSRGNGGQVIYRDRKDPTAFLEHLGEAGERYEIVIHSYCLMTNHYHLVVETPHGNLSAAMHWLNSVYAHFFNRKHAARGHLFQGRFKSILVHAERYLAWLSRYVHLNPVRAGLVTRPGEYRWSSYRAFTGDGRCPEWLETDLLLGRFGRMRRRARSAYRGFVEGDEGKDKDAEIAHCLQEGRILGDEAFLDSLEKLGEGGTVASSRMRRRARPTLEALLKGVSDTLHVTRNDLVGKGRKHNLPRDIAIYLVHRSCGLTGKEIGGHFGGIRPSTVSMRVRTIRERLTWDRELHRQVSNIEARLTLRRIWRSDSLSVQG